VNLQNEITNTFINRKLPFKMSQEITIPDEIITSKIYLIRNQKIMLDSDLDELLEKKGSQKPITKIGYKK
jgi:hypothetical protein